MIMAITFSRQIVAGSRASTAWYRENLELLAELVLKFKGLYDYRLLN